MKNEANETPDLHANLYQFGGAVYFRIGNEYSGSEPDTIERTNCLFNMLKEYGVTSYELHSPKTIMFGEIH